MLDLTDGYFFRPLTSNKKSLANRPFVGNGPKSCLKVYFSALSDPEDLLLRAHDGPSGVAITLQFLGATEEEVMDHGRWASRKTFKHYTEVERLMKWQRTVQILSNAVASSEEQSIATDAAGHFYRLLNSGFGAQRAFPLPTAQYMPKISIIIMGFYVRLCHLSSKLTTLNHSCKTNLRTI